MKEDRPDPLQRKGSVKGGAGLERKGSVKGSTLEQRRGSVKKGSPIKSGQGEGGNNELTESQQSDDPHHPHQVTEVSEKKIEGPCEVHVYVVEVDFDFDAAAAVADGRLQVRSYHPFLSTPCSSCTPLPSLSLISRIHPALPTTSFLFLLYSHTPPTSFFSNLFVARFILPIL